MNGVPGLTRMPNRPYLLRVPDQTRMLNRHANTTGDTLTFQTIRKVDALKIMCGSKGSIAVLKTTAQNERQLIAIFLY
jgi:hypothetical protein